MKLILVDVTWTRTGTTIAGDLIRTIDYTVWNLLVTGVSVLLWKCQCYKHQTMIIINTTPYPDSHKSHQDFFSRTLSPSTFFILAPCGATTSCRCYFSLLVAIVIYLLQLAANDWNYRSYGSLRGSQLVVVIINLHFQSGSRASSAIHLTYT